MSCFPFACAPPKDAPPPGHLTDQQTAEMTSCLMFLHVKGVPSPLTYCLGQTRTGSGDLDKEHVTEVPPPAPAGPEVSPEGVGKRQLFYASCLLE